MKWRRPSMKYWMRQVGCLTEIGLVGIMGILWWSWMAIFEDRPTATPSRLKVSWSCTARGVIELDDRTMHWVARRSQYNVLSGSPGVVGGDVDCHHIGLQLKFKAHCKYCKIVNVLNSEDILSGMRCTWYCRLNGSEIWVSIIYTCDEKQQQFFNANMIGRNGLLIGWNENILFNVFIN